MPPTGSQHCPSQLRPPQQSGAPVQLVPVLRQLQIPASQTPLQQSEPDEHAPPVGRQHAPAMPGKEWQTDPAQQSLSTVQYGPDAMQAQSPPSQMPLQHPGSGPPAVP